MFIPVGEENTRFSPGSLEKCQSGSRLQVMAAGPELDIVLRERGTWRPGRGGGAGPEAHISSAPCSSSLFHMKVALSHGTLVKMNTLPVQSSLEKR